MLLFLPATFYSQLPASVATSSTTTASNTCSVVAATMCNCAHKHLYQAFLNKYSGGESYTPRQDICAVLGGILFEIYMELIMETRTADEVGDWIAHRGYPQYRPCFVKNVVDGRKLRSIEASTLPQLGITDFKHIQEISQMIRQEFGLETPNAKRSIAEIPFTTH
eukprot:gene10693-2791_t